jgi:hypothetical protein
MTAMGGAGTGYSNKDEEANPPAQPRRNIAGCFCHAATSPVAEHHCRSGVPQHHRSLAATAIQPRRNIAGRWLPRWPRGRAPTEPMTQPPKRPEMTLYMKIVLGKLFNSLCFWYSVETRT